MKIVIALGGNALQTANQHSPQDQLQSCRLVAKKIAALISQGHEIIITHGNGPQVGTLLKSFESSHQANPDNPLFSLNLCNAFSQAYIGYDLQNSLIKNQIQAASIVTQVVVDKNDPAFNNPSKPIGSFYNEQQAQALMQEHDFIMREDAGRGWRRVVASPAPIAISEIDSIQALLKQGITPICCGGGGIPVYQNGASLTAIDAVIDKDLTAALLAKDLNADLLLILTNVDAVYIDYNSDHQQALTDISIAKLTDYIKANQFSKGSMLPKVKAAMAFASTGKTSIVGHLNDADKIIQDKMGTWIHQ